MEDIDIRNIFDIKRIINMSICNICDMSIYYTDITDINIIKIYAICYISIFYMSIFNMRITNMYLIFQI